MRYVTNVYSFGSILGAALLLSTAVPALATEFHNPERPSGVATGTCTEGAAGYSVATGAQSTSKTGWTPINGTSISFSQGTAGCVEVSFSAETATVPGENLLARVVLDGKTVCTPTDNLFGAEGSSDNPADRAMNYICPSVTTGSHKVAVQFASRFGGKVAVDYRTTIVRYAP